MNKPAQMRQALAIHRERDVPFEKAWQEAMRGCFGKRASEWREAVEWAEPVFRDAYHHTGKVYKLAPNMVEETVL